MFYIYTMENSLYCDMNQTNIQVIITIVELKIEHIHSMANGHFRNPFKHIYNVLFSFFKLWIVTNQLKKKERYLLINELSYAANTECPLGKGGNQGKPR